jgi:peptide/nickel transport system substrate-binding protein
LYSNLPKQLVFLLLGLCTIITIIAIGCAPAPSTPTAPASPTGTQIKMGGVPKFSFSRDASVIGYPPKWSSPVEYAYYPCAIENLGYFDEKGGVVPGLATDWKADYATKTITVTLRKGIKFHDGTDFNATAAKWNIDQYIAAKKADILISSCDVIDDSTIRINMPSWDSDCVWKMLYYAGAMISPTSFQKAGADDKARQDWALTNPVGTGPFIFVSKQRDVKTIFKKNPAYWQAGKPYLDGFEWDVIADPLVQVASLKSGEIDAICDCSPKDASGLKAAGYNIKLAPGQGGAYLNWGNSLNPDSPFSKLEVRQALSYCVDTKAVVDNLYYGFAKVSNQWAFPGTFEYNPDVVGFPYNPEKAKQLLAQAGYPNGFKTVFHLPNNPTQVNLVTAVQGYMKAVGMDATLDIMDEGRRQSVSYTDGWDGINFVGPRAWGILSQERRFLHGTKGNYPGHTKSTLKTPDIDTLLDDAFQAQDSKTQQQLLWQAQKMIIDKYCIFGVLMMTYAPAAESTKVMKSGYFETYAGQFKPPVDCWLNK